MLTFEEIKKIFEFKPDIYQFLNSPLFFLIVVVAVVVFLLALLLIRRCRNRPKKKIKFKKGEESEETISEDTAQAQSDFYERQIRDKEAVEESSDYEEPVVPETKVDEKEMVILELGECVILKKDNESVTVLYNKDGTPEVKRLPLSEKECKHDLTTTRRKPEYHPYVPETERAIPLEKPKDGGIVKKVIRYSPDEVGDVEREVDELAVVKKKPNFLNRMAILGGERFMKGKKKEEETIVEHATETTDAKRQLTKKEVFEENDIEKETMQDQVIETGLLKKETAKEPQKEDMQPTLPEGESKRQVVTKLLEQGKTKDEILKITGYAELTVIKYVTDWTDSQLNIARQLFADGRWGLVKKIVEILDKKETFLVEDGKLYYPGRDKLTYVFLASTIIELIAIIVLFFTIL